MALILNMNNELRAGFTLSFFETLYFVLALTVSEVRGLWEISN